MDSYWQSQIADASAQIGSIKNDIASLSECDRFRGREIERIIKRIEDLESVAHTPSEAESLADNLRRETTEAAELIKLRTIYRSLMLEVPTVPTRVAMKEAVAFYDENPDLDPCKN